MDDAKEKIALGQAIIICTCLVIMAAFTVFMVFGAAYLSGYLLRLAM